MNSNGWKGGLEGRPLLHDHPIALRVSLLLWLLGGVIFVALWVPALESVAQRFDDAVHSLAVDYEFDPVVQVAKVLDFVGSIWVTFPIMILVGVYLLRRRRLEGLVYWVSAMLVSQVLIGPLKALYARPRPPLPLVETSGYSFPSGHSVAGAAIAVALVIVLVPPGPQRRNLEMLAAAFAVVMGLSRVYLRAHWFSDAAAGVALGAAVAVAVAAIMHYAAARSREAPT